MRENPQGLELLLLIHVINYSWLFKSYVKMFISRGQYAWVTKKTTVSKQRYNQNFLIKTSLSKQKQFYTTDHKNDKLNPWFVTGLIDSEGCFSINIYQAKAYITGWTIKPSFKLTVHKKDLALLEKLQNFFGVGKIYKQRADSLEYRIQNLKELGILISHLDKYPLFTQKQSDYKLFRKAIYLMLDKNHLSMNGLKEIISIKATINWGLSDTIKMAFPEIIPIDRPNISKPAFINGYWLSGFISGDGCFLCTILKSKSKLGETVSLRFVITQHLKDEELLRNIIDYFGCGNLYKKNERVFDLVVSKISDISNIIIPFLIKYPIDGEKYQDFLSFFKIVEIINNKAHLTKEGLDQIHSIQPQVDGGRDNLSSDCSVNLSIPADLDKDFSENLTTNSLQSSGRKN